MRYLSAQFIFTNTGPPLKRGIITVEDDGTIVSIENTEGVPEEKASVEFHNGIIIPGFVNCHCHLELSHMKGIIPRGTGLPGFIKGIRTSREAETETILTSVAAADDEMFREGVVLCADTCNTRNTFDTKRRSKIKYVNLLEVFGIDSEKADRRLDEILLLSRVAGDYMLEWWIVPHSVYSLSLPLFRLLRLETAFNNITSVHFLETEAEKSFVKDHSGPIIESYRESGLATGELQTVSGHVSAVLEEITPSGNLLLVHNTFIDKDVIRSVRKRGMLYWCLCPNSNLYIGKQMPPVDLMIGEECEIVIGTDSLASNDRLSILGELKAIQEACPAVSMEDLVIWGSLNGAEALGKIDQFGTLEPGKKPGILLLQDVDLINMRLLPESSVRRLI